MRITVVLMCALLLVGCAQSNRLGMMPSADGNMYGSAVEKNMVVDASQFADNTIKVTIRNTSGDTSLNLYHIKSEIEKSLRGRGYEPVAGSNNDFAIRYDINVTYSGYVRQDMRSELGALGAIVGGIAGYRSSTDAGTAIGIVTGATLGAIVGSYASTDTYITITDVTLAVKDQDMGRVKRKIVFDSSEELQKTRKAGISRYSDTVENKVAVYAGGQNTPQENIITEVKARLTRILADLI
ncbi:MAG: complement resistance protein TraT [Chromatiales bacterium]|nr:complement resistance protein TraT [Chromatiales bacterium]